MEGTLFTELNENLWLSFEEALFPSDSTAHFSSSFFKKSAKVVALSPALILSSGLSVIEKISRYAISKIKGNSSDSISNFSEILKDSTKWKHLGDVGDRISLNPPGYKDQNFLWGVASCTYQDSGFDNCPNSQWADWEKKILEGNNQSKKSIDLFSIYQHNPKFIVEKLNQLGVNSFRTSLEWSQIEPSPGTYNQEALDIYINLFKVLKDHGIEPMVTLHHFSEPKWFHEIGSFENEQNISHFINFASFVYPKITQIYKGDPLVKWICTINEPSIEAFSRYVRGAYSPGVKLSFSRAANFLKGALKAHFAVYKKLKTLNSNAQIGFTHQYLKFEAGNPLVLPITRPLTSLINDVVLGVFREKAFSLKVPLICNIEEKFEENDVQSDFIGVQFYTRPIISLTGSISQNYEEAMTQMPFREDPAGLYEAITETHQASKLPIIVTENGISTTSDLQRERYLTRALFALKKAEEDLPEGVLKGYYLWSFVDNLEWDLGMKPQAFGAFSSTEGENGLEMDLEPKRGIGIYKKIIDAWKNIYSKAA